MAADVSLVVDIDTSGATRGVDAVKRGVEGLGKKAAAAGDALGKMANEKVVIPVVVDSAKAQRDIKKTIDISERDFLLGNIPSEETTKPAQVPVAADTTNAKTETKKLTEEIKKQNVAVKVDADTTSAVRGVDRLKQSMTSLGQKARAMEANLRKSMAGFASSLAGNLGATAITSMSSALVDLARDANKGMQSMEKSAIMVGRDLKIAGNPDSIQATKDAIQKTADASGRNAAMIGLQFAALADGGNKTLDMLADEVKSVNQVALALGKTDEETVALTESWDELGKQWDIGNEKMKGLILTLGQKAKMTPEQMAILPGKFKGTGVSAERVAGMAIEAQQIGMLSRDFVSFLNDVKVSKSGRMFMPSDYKGLPREDVKRLLGAAPEDLGRAAGFVQPFAQQFMGTRAESQARAEARAQNMAMMGGGSAASLYSTATEKFYKAVDNFALGVTYLTSNEKEKRKIEGLLREQSINIQKETAAAVAK